MPNQRSRFSFPTICNQTASPRNTSKISLRPTLPRGTPLLKLRSGGLEPLTAVKLASTEIPVASKARLPFLIYQDECLPKSEVDTPGVKADNGNGNSGHCKDVLSTLEYDDSNKENIAPEGYQADSEDEY